MAELFDLDLLDDTDRQPSGTPVRALPLGIDGIYEAWESDPLFYPAIPPAHWLMVAEVEGRVLVVPLAPPDSGDPSRCRPIGCYEAAVHLADQYRRNR